MIATIFTLVLLLNINTYNGGDKADHAIYVSVMEVIYVGDNKGTLKLKLFADDLEDAIYNQVSKRYDLLGGECTLAKNDISNYLQEHLELMIDNRRAKLNFVGCELNDISLWTSFEFQTSSEWNSVSIKADYLMELFPTQSNVVSLTKGEEKRMFRLLKGDVQKTISF